MPTMNMSDPATEAVDERDRFNYQFLARLQQDCDYYLGFGNRARKHLWAGDEVAQIREMRNAFEALPQKPEWITLERIAQYEAAMVMTGD